MVPDKQYNTLSYYCTINKKKAQGKNWGVPIILYKGESPAAN
jgi:hypothetical protein